MKNSDHFLKKIDHLAFAKIDVFIQSNIYQKYTDFLKSFSQETKVIINKSIILASVIIPSIVLLIFYISNQQYDSMVKTKREISVLGTKIIKYRNSVGKNTESIIASGPLINKNDFDSALRNVVNKLNLNLTNFQTSDFVSAPKDTFQEASGIITFSKLSTENLFNFLFELSNTEKFKIYEIKIQRDQQVKLLNGTISILHYGLNNMALDN